MAKKQRIFTVGFNLPGEEFEQISFDSDKTLLDADIILFKPTLGSFYSDETHNGKTLLNEELSFSTNQRLIHWRDEINSALKAGKIVVIFLSKPQEYYRYTGEKQYSGTGGIPTTTKIVTPISSYEIVADITKVIPKSGTGISLDKNARYLAAYWSEFAKYSPYEVEIEGNFDGGSNQILLRSSSGNKIIGAAIITSAGSRLYLPPLTYEKAKFIHTDPKTYEPTWTEEALQFGKRLVTALVSLSNSLKQLGEATPKPAWVTEDKYRISTESDLEFKISECSSEIDRLQTQKSALENSLVQSGSLRRLLFEQGKPLEEAILEALRLLGFSAETFTDGKSEFDAVFTSPEGRCLGESEGKDNKAIAIEKFSQLERNINEDLAHGNVSEKAKGVLFGNAYRLQPLEERGEFFTEKCKSAAVRTGFALVKTTDLFISSRYLKENSSDNTYALKCREAIFKTEGKIVSFPQIPIQSVSISKKPDKSKVNKANNRKKATI
jgi:hypothetical protein